MSKKYDIFISYRRENGQAIAVQIAESLKAKHYSVFIDVQGMGSGSFPEQLHRRIDEAKDVIVVLSKGSLDRCVNEGDWVKEEIVYAMAKHKNIIPIASTDFVEPEVWPEELKGFSRYHRQEFNLNYYEAVIERIDGMLSSKSIFRSILPWIVSVVGIAAIVIFIAVFIKKHQSVNQEYTLESSHIPENADISESIIESEATISSSTENIIATGKCGADVTYVLDESGVLTVSGSGSINNYERDGATSTAPWFEDKGDITRLIIEDGIDEIGEYAFAYLENIKEITLPESLVSIDNRAFYNTDIRSIIIPSNVEKIERGAFARCHKLQEVTIPESLVEFVGNPFWGCENLTEISVSDKNSVYMDIDGVVFTNDYKELVAYPSGKEDSEYTVPDGVEQIGNLAFSDNSILEKVILPDSVTEIHGYAFSIDSSLQSINLPDGLTTIYQHAFDYCTSLTSITIPAGVGSIANGVFAYEKDYFEVTFLGSPSIDNTDGDGAFYGTTAIISIPDEDVWKTWEDKNKCLDYGGTLTYQHE